MSMLDLAPMRKRSRNVHEDERHTVPIKARVKPELAAKVRALLEERGVTYAEVLEAGLAVLAAAEKPDP